MGNKKWYNIDMQNEPLNEETIKTQLPSEILQPEIKKKRNKLSIIIVVSVLVLLVIIFNESQFVSIFVAVSIPFIITYLASRNTYKEISLHKMITRPTFYLLLVIFNVIMFFVILILLTPKNGNLGLGALPIFLIIIFGELIFDIIAVIIYELILRYKIKTGRIK